MMERRRFLSLVAGASLGAIFVPKYERWFRPLSVARSDMLYVATWGSDLDGRGTRFDPYASVGRALSGWDHGQHRTVSVAGGDYYEAIVTPERSSLLIHTSPARDTVFHPKIAGGSVFHVRGYSHLAIPQPFTILPGDGTAIRYGFPSGMWQSARPQQGNQEDG